ncbi:uncharacterized protein LOC122637687 isoform X2 [Vespula pensylvanica]|uniref:uncharacterized protein LOC122637687 isoform X2 n=1 Tax=Vespula pensylvanica TaxID=30213 RepID=UPI001CB9FD15|nr:uncharacterized protein LOC122637687 isoform X2 [Vespula pensylvanica]XP_050870046.1 uncharacterized protein LOC127073061 isoform X2 [Vespula vulgaris]
MSALCCIGLSVASRIIGTYTLALSILIINVFMSHFFMGNHEHDFFGTLESWAPIGLNWTLIFKYFRLDRQSQVIAICSYAILVYSMLFLISSAYLTYGSITRKSKYAVPWLYMQMVSIIDQSTALGIQLMHERTQCIFLDGRAKCTQRMVEKQRKSTNLTNIWKPYQ